MNTKYLITSLVFLFFGATLNAQEIVKEPRETLQFGVKAGINVSNVWDEKGQDFEADPKLGFAGGVFLGIPLGKLLGLQPEILISQKGLKGSGTLLGTSYSFSRTTTHLDIPLQLQLKPANFITVVLGPQYSFLMSRKETYTFGTNSIEQEREFNNDNIRKNTLGFVAGTDLIFSHIVVSGRLGWDFQTNNGDGTSSTPRYKNRWFQLTLGYKI